MNLNLKRGLLVTGVLGAITAGACYSVSLENNSTSSSIVAAKTDNNLDIKTVDVNGNTVSPDTTTTNNDSPFVNDDYMKDKSLEPKIGDTEQQVIDSSWGNTGDKTTTKDSYGTSAMWFYNDGKSIFFIDGKVNSITQ